MSGTDDLAGLTVRLCGYCGRPIPGRRKDARYCSTSHRVLGNRKAKKAQVIHDSLVTRQSGEFTDHESLTDAYERQAEFARADAPYVVPHDDDCDEQNIYADDAGRDDDLNQLWSASLGLQRQLDKLLAEYDRRARPFLATQARNRGVVLPQLVQLKREYATMAQELIDNHERTSALERADHTRHRRAEDAHDRAAGQRAMAEFAQDLRHLGINLPNAGRATSDAFKFGMPSNAFPSSDREMYRTSAVARNMMQRLPGDERSWR